jgi:bacterial/archaeal transporter family protein
MTLTLSFSTPQESSVRASPARGGKGGLLASTFYILHSKTMQWLFWSILSAFFAGLTALLAKIGVANINSNLATAIRTSVILLVTWGIALANPASLDFQSISKKTWTFLILSAFATGASWLCYFRALQIGALSKVAPIDKLSVVIAMVFGILFLQERLSPKEWIGGSVIVAGALILAWK